MNHSNRSLTWRTHYPNCAFASIKRFALSSYSVICLLFTHLTHTPTRSSNAHSTFCDTTHNAKFPQISTQIINKIRWNTFRILLFSFFNCAPKFSFYEVVKWSQQYVAIGLTTVRIVAHWNHTVSRGERAERNRGTIICCVQQPPEKRAYKKKKKQETLFSYSTLRYIVFSSFGEKIALDGTTHTHIHACRERE